MVEMLKADGNFRGMTNGGCENRYDSCMMTGGMECFTILALAGLPSVYCGSVNNRSAFSVVLWSISTRAARVAP